jgi:release factor glutamine methyltransferase
MTLSELYAELCGLLGSRFEAAQLLRHVTGKDAHSLPRFGGVSAGEGAARTLRGLCARRLEGVPLQYLLGEWEFYGLPFRVGEGVLIPRPDTEALVDLAHELMKPYHSPDHPGRPELLDLCSGTGCIAIALESLLPGASITALEISPPALGYLRENIGLNQSHVRAAEADLAAYTHPNPIDLLTANPPYIPAGDIAALQPEVQREPRLALDGGADGLDFYRVIAARYKSQLAPGGYICLEVGIRQAADVCGILAANGFAGIGVKNDLAGVERVVFAKK